LVSSGGFNWKQLTIYRQSLYTSLPSGAFSLANSSDIFAALGSPEVLTRGNKSGRVVAH
jgi:hypothetical protein